MIEVPESAAPPPSDEIGITLDHTIQDLAEIVIDEIFPALPHSQTAQTLGAQSEGHFMSEHTSLYLKKVSKVILVLLASTFATLLANLIKSG